jgi:hypothetical protein
MSEQDWFNRVALGFAVVVLVGFVAGLGLAGAFGAGGAGHAANAAGGAAPVHLYLTVAFNPVSGMDEYFPANFTVPAHTPVILTITSFDNGTNVVPAVYSLVTGAVGGTEMVTEHGVSNPMTSVPTNGLAHTFTMMPAMSSGMPMHGMSMGGMPMVNLPIPSAPSQSDPVTVSGEFYFNTTGQFSWQCMAPCDAGAMAQAGMMAGTVTVD